MLLLLCTAQGQAGDEGSALQDGSRGERTASSRAGRHIAERQVEVTSLTEARDASQLELATVQADLEQLRVSFNSYLLEQCEEEEAIN